MITVMCKTYRAKSDGENIVLEIANAEPVNLVPQLLTKLDVASRLGISVRKIEEIVRSGRLSVVRVDGAVRFREEDVLRFLAGGQEPVLKAIVEPLPVGKSKQQVLKICSSL